MANQRAGILGTGHAYPEGILTNADLAQMVETSDDWITTRTGIKQRRKAAPNEYTSLFAVRAVRQAIESARLDPSDIDLLICATVSPDQILPSTGCIIQAEIGANNAAAMDVVAACSGFLYGVSLADSMIRTGQVRHAVVVGAEVLTQYVDYTDRQTCVLFGDGAGAAILRNRPNAHGLLTAVMGADGRKADLLFMAGGGSRCPATAQSVDARLHYLRMEGKETFKNAVQAMETAAAEALRRCELQISQIKLVVPHQANLRIIEAVGKRLGARPEQLFVNLHKYGNTSAASVAIALDEAVHSGMVQGGDLLLLVVFGAGLTWGAAVIEW